MNTTGFGNLLRLGPSASLIALSLCVAAAVGIPASQAAKYTWTGAVDGNWNDNTGKWSVNGNPALAFPDQQADEALDDQPAAPHTVTLNVNLDIAALTLDSPVATLTTTGRTLKVPNFSITRGTVLWSASTYQGGITNGAGGTLVMDGISDVTPWGPFFDDGTITVRALGGNQAKVTMTGSVRVRNNGKLILTSQNGAAAATWDGRSPPGDILSGVFYTDRGGEVRIEQGAGGARTFRTGFLFANGGKVSVQATATFDIGGANPIDFLNYGTFDVSANQTAVFLGGKFQNSKENGVLGKTTGKGSIDVSQMATPRIVNQGEVAPGNSPGVLTVIGGFEQSGGGLLTIELGGDVPGIAYDQLAVTGLAQLADTLRVSLIDGFQPALGAQFDILQAGSVSGQFDVLDLPPGMTVEYGPTYVRLHQGVVTAAEPGPSTLALQVRNPTTNALVARFSLPTSAPATIDVWDIGGRRLATRELGSSGPGWHEIALGGLPSGIYLVRLRQAGHSRTTRVAILR